MKILRNIGMLAIIVTCCTALQAQESDVLDGFYVREHNPQRKPIGYAQGNLLREANVMWSKRVWRRVDMREKINHPLYYPTAPIKDRMSLFDHIKNAIVNEGTLTAYSPGPLGTNDEFTEPMTVDEVKKLLFRVDTVQTQDLETGQFIDKLVEQETKSGAILQYELKEDWFFDKERSVMDVRIIGICPMKEKIDENTGEFRGFERLFWIYFPEARYVFANAPVYNRGNESERMTLDDIFWKRMFGSYIVKESNVYDRAIIQYKTGLDALLEAEKIKEEIFIMEHDLWHF